MRIKQSLLQKSSSSSRRQPAPDLDPTSNLTLHQEIWDKLKDKIANHSPKSNESAFLESITLDSNAELFGIPLDSLPAFSNPSSERRFGQDVRRLLKVVCRAILNPIYIPWDVEDYYTACLKAKKDPKRIKFPNPQFGAFAEPLTVVDSKGRIVLWYLPALLSEQHQLDVRNATVSIGPLLKESVKPQGDKSCSPNWRINQAHFAVENHQRICQPGAINFSGGWFGQGHHTDEFPLRPSLNIRTRTTLGQPEWLTQSNHFERILNLTLSLIHPGLFKCGLAMLQKLRASGPTMEIAKQWQSVYTGIAIISNRITPAHRDSKGKPEWFDLLMNYAGHETQPKLLIHDLGLELNYSSGTVVGLCGTIFEHEVRAWGDGDRVCYAHFMREAVRKRLEAEDPGWVYQSMYLL